MKLSDLRIINEDLTDIEKKDVVKRMSKTHSQYRKEFLKQHPKALDLFTNHKDEKEWTTRFKNITLENEGIPDQTVIETLRDKGYKTSNDDYKQGITKITKQVGNPDHGIPLRDKEITVKIGKVLEDEKADKSIKSAYMNDTFRQLSSNNKFDIVITGNPFDVYGGSTGRGWTSCSNMRDENGKLFKNSDVENRPGVTKMSGEINNHTHMAYLLPVGGSIDTDAIGRMSFKFHKGITTNHGILVSEGNIYGTAPTSFKQKAIDIMNSIFDGPLTDECYIKPSEVYDDNQQTIILPKEVSPEKLDLIIQKIPKGNIDYYSGYVTELLGKASNDIQPNPKLYKNKILKGFASVLEKLKEGSEHKSLREIVSSISTATALVPSGVESVIEKWTSYSQPNKFVKSVSDQLNDVFLKNNSIESNLDVLTVSSLKITKGLLASYMIHNLIRVLPHPKTPVELENVWNLSRGQNIKVNLVSNHKFGNTPLKTMVEYLVKNNKVSYQNIESLYDDLHSHDTFNGTFPDFVVYLKNENVKGMETIFKTIVLKCSKMSKADFESFIKSSKKETKDLILDLLPEHNSSFNDI